MKLKIKNTKGKTSTRSNSRSCVQRRIVKDMKTGIEEINETEVKETGSITTEEMMSVQKSVEIVATCHGTDLIGKSRDSRARLKDMYKCVTGFKKIHSNFKNLSVDQYTTGLRCFMGAPLLFMTWEEIVDSRVPIRNFELANLLKNKIIWSHAHKHESGVTERLKRVYNDSTARLDLVSSDSDSFRAVIRLSIPNRALTFDLEVWPVDCFFLKMLPNEADKKQIDLITKCIGEDVIHLIKQQSMS